MIYQIIQTSTAGATAEIYQMPTNYSGLIGLRQPSKSPQYYQEIKAGKVKAGARRAKEARMRKLRKSL